MKLSYRQGIVRYQTDPSGQIGTFLQKSAQDNQFIDLVVSPDPTIITFAHGTSNYTYEESKTVENAWGPFAPTGETQYLYWDIDYISGKLARGHTIFPVIIQSGEPLVRRANQHWFDLASNEMRVWDTNRGTWVVKIRVFAGTYNSSAIIVPEPYATSQVGLNNINPMVKTGHILFDSNSDPIKDRFGKFITSEHTISTQQSNANSSSAFQLEGEIKTVTSTGFIPRFSLVSLLPGNKITRASYTNPSRIVNGLVGEDFYDAETGRLITGGLVRNEHWDWPEAKIGKPLFCGLNGELTTTPPASGFCQIVGSVYDKNTVNIQIQIPFIL